MDGWWATQPDTTAIRLWQVEATADPYRGRALRGLLTQAGFERVIASSKYVCYGTATAVEAFGTARSGMSRRLVCTRVATAWAGQWRRVDGHGTGLVGMVALAGGVCCVCVVSGTGMESTQVVQTPDPASSGPMAAPSCVLRHLGGRRDAARQMMVALAARPAIPSYARVPHLCGDKEAQRADAEEQQHLRPAEVATQCLERHGGGQRQSAPRR